MMLVLAISIVVITNASFIALVAYGIGYDVGYSTGVSYGRISNEDEGGDE